MEQFKKDPKNDALFKKSIISTYLDHLNDEDFPPLKKTLAYDFANYKNNSGKKLSNSSFDTNFSKYLKHYLDNYNRTFELENAKGSYIFFKEDILYLLNNHPELNSANNILSFIEPGFASFTIKNELTSKNIYIVHVFCECRVFARKLLKYYKTHERKPDFITRLDTSLFLSYNNKNDLDFIYQELEDSPLYDRDYFINLLNDEKKKSEYIDFIIDNYRRIHKTK